MPIASLNKTITLALSVSDRHASATWYAEILGFTLRYHADEMGWSEMATLTEGVTLGFGDQGAASPGNATPVFGTDDLDASRLAMEAAGVVFEGDTDVMDGMVKLATFFDPDGNTLMLAQDLAEAAPSH